MAIASSHLFTSLWSLLCLCYFQLHSSIEGGRERERETHTHAREPFLRPVAMNGSSSIGGQDPRSCKRCFDAHTPSIHQKQAAFSATSSSLYSVVYISNISLVGTHILHCINFLFARPSPLCPQSFPFPACGLTITPEIVRELLRCKIISVQHTPWHHLLCNSLTP